MTSTPLAQVLAPILFVALMVVLLFGGLALSALLDSSLWVPKRSGLGWIIDFSNSHARLALLFSIGWMVLLFLGLAGLSHPEAPIIGGLIQGLNQLLGAL